MKKDKKPFSETKLGRFLSDKVAPVAGTLLQLGGDITGIDALEKVGEFLNKEADKDTEEAGRYKALLLEFEEKKLEYQLEFQKIELEKLQIDLEVFKAEAADRDSAREAHIERIKAMGGNPDKLFSFLVITSICMTFAVLVFLAFGQPVADGHRDLFNMAIGSVFTWTGSAYAYYLGTTRGSKQKDETIKQAVTR
jgi:hypothetical protein